MKLIKDLIEDRIVFYWTIEDVRVSPTLASLEHAAEWFVKFHHDQYIGEERRSSTIDRRKLHTVRSKTEAMHVTPTNPIGRRVTDKHVVVHVDLAKDKIKKIMKQLEELERLENEDQ